MPAILQVEFCPRAAHTGSMRRFGFIIALCTSLLWQGAHAGSYELTDGTRVSGDPIHYDETGVSLKTADGDYPPRIPWGKFTGEALRKLRDDAMNPQQRAIVELMLFDDIPSRKAPVPEIHVQPIQPPARPSGHVGVLALFTSPLGRVMLLILYGTNLFAAYEVAIFRNQPWQTVCGLAAIPLLGAASPIYFLALPSRPFPQDESAPSGGAAAQAPYAPRPLSSAAPVASEGFALFSARGPAAPNPVAAAPAQEDLPAPVVYQRGDFLFNRRFFETKLAGFFRVVLSEADKELRIHIKAARGDFVGKRISRITPTELYLQVFKESATADEMIPFAEILEVQIRHKDLA